MGEVVSCIYVDSLEFDEATLLGRDFFLQSIENFERDFSLRRLNYEIDIFIAAYVKCHFTLAKHNS